MDRARFKVANEAGQGEEGVSPPLTIVPIAKWCREGRWINGKLYNGRNEIIFENTPRNRHGAAGTPQSGAWLEIPVFGETCVVRFPTLEDFDHGPLGPNA